MSKVIAMKKASKDEQSVVPTNEQLLTKQQACNLCNISSRTMNDWMKRKIIRYLKIGKTVRFVPSEVKASLGRYAQGAAA